MTTSHLNQEVACYWSQFTAKATLLHQLFSAHVNTVDTYRYYRYLSTVPVRRQADDVIGRRKRTTAFWHVRPCSVTEVGGVGRACQWNRILLPSYVASYPIREQYSWLPTVQYQISHYTQILLLETHETPQQTEIAVMVCPYHDSMFYKGIC